MKGKNSIGMKNFNSKWHNKKRTTTNKNWTCN